MKTNRHMLSDNISNLIYRFTTKYKAKTNLLSYFSSLSIVIDSDTNSMMD